ncbi:DUF4336 domain-containing protein [Thalassospira lucentensis]|uniref:DUF4336 domain-containing protein n=1 Tax=Thalassospira lucentensis TaxID=168935 RepID=A0A358HN36_9PROT|nr:DUF4336 domain-containing protein [Thalassospira lucentensis]HBU96603.1 DUF4336 domain-containing protein [Thalassospira lucentensis]HCW65796.1 DUF4336 domain-containing protein [Thalassospira lucentensis]|tara:strand:+ start:129 stop:878 length:750 start_codon:yes stop_codon:yes gene_type:complete
MFSVETYAPLDTLKPVGDNIWIVDGPVIGFQYLGMKLPFSTRMTVVRLANNKLFIHSPIRLSDQLRAEIDALGDVRFLIAPNTIHYAGVPDWQKAYPNAKAFCAPGVVKRAKSVGLNVQFDGELADTPEPEWQDDIKQILVRGGYLNEAVFFHTTSDTLILTDLIENFEPDKIKSPIWRFFIRLFGTMDPHGSAPRDMRATFIGHKDNLRKCIQTMIDWNPTRVILAHGRWYDTNAVSELKRAFRWVLK